MNLSAFSDDLELLANILRGGSFRFIVIGHDDEAIAPVLADWLKKRFPERPFLELPLFDKTYRQVMDELLAFEKGTVLIPDLEWLFHPINSELCVAFNQRRDFLAKMDLAFVCLMPATDFVVLPKKLPDWFSIRSGEFDFSSVKEPLRQAQFVPPVLEKEDPRLSLYNAVSPWIYRRAKELGKRYGLSEWESEYVALATLEDIFFMNPDVVKNVQDPRGFVFHHLNKKIHSIRNKGQEILPAKYLPEDSYEEAFEENLDSAQILQTFIKTLSDQDQQLLRYYLDDLSHLQMANLLGHKNTAAIKSRVARLKHMLRQFYQNYQRTEQTEKTKTE